VNNWTRKKKARGFTLVELLIVIVIIGILAGSMLLVFGSATDSAKATRVVSELRSLKAAAMMYYADNSDWPTGNISALSPYMDRDPATGEYCDYEVTSDDTGMNVASGDSLQGVPMPGVWVRTKDLKTKNEGVYNIFVDNSNPSEKAKEAGVGVNTNEIGMILEKFE
jgi:general secretion pathway protein G